MVGAKLMKGKGLLEARRNDARLDCSHTDYAVFL